MPDGQVFNTRNPTFMSSLLLAQSAINEEPIHIMWTTILGTWFPPVGPQTFKLAIKSPSPMNNGQPDAIIIEVRFVGVSARNPAQFEEWQIFMVECKPRDHDTPGGWHGAFTQLDDYLKANTINSRKLFSAVAIGTKVVIYEWERVGEDSDEETTMRPIHDGTFDLGKPADRIAFETALTRVRSQG